MPKKYRLKSARVYVITNLVNGKQYVGMTTRTPVQRFEQHCYLALKGSKGRLHQAIREYGANSLKVEKLEEFSSWPEAMEGEIRYIKKLRPEYNATLGGEGGWGAIRTPEFCENLRRRGNLPESQERWAKYVHKGSKSLSRPFIDLITEEVFTSVRKAAIELKVPKGRLYSVLRGNYAERIKNQKTPRVRFLTEPECTARGLRHNPPVQWSACRRERFKAAKQSQCKPVLLLEEGTSFPSLEAALTYLGHPFNARQQSYAHDCIRGKRGFRGWHFEYTPREVA